MNIHISFWIYAFGFILQLQFAASNVTVTDSSILNLIVENLTETDFDKQLKTNDYNSNDSFSSNSVNTGPLHSHQINEECKNGDCSRNGHNSMSIDSLSTASKILWNLVSTVKTTNQHSVSDKINIDEGITVSPVNNAVNTHSHDRSNMHNSSSNSSDNELDSDISLENDMLNITYSNEGTNNSSSHLTFLDLNFTTTTKQSVVTPVESKLTKLYTSEENSTVVWESTETYPDVFTSDSDLFNILHVSEHTTTPDIPETTVYSADEELDLTSHILNSFDSNGTEFVNEMSNHSQVIENSTTGMFYSEIDSLNYEYNESSTLFSVNNDMATESGISRLKDLTNITNFESYTVSDEKSSTPLTENENETVVYHNYDISLEAEELKSKDNHSIITTDLGQDAQISHSTTSASVIETLLDGNLWLMSEDIFNNMSNSTISNTDSSVYTEIPISEPDIKAALMTSIKHDSSSERDLLPTEASENFTVIADSSTDTSEVTDQFSYLSQETQMSTTHTDLFYTIQNISSMINDSSENVKNNNLWNDATINGSLESTEMTYLNFSEDVEKSNEVVSTNQNLSTTASSHINDTTENPLGLDTIVSHDLSVSEIIKENATHFVSSMETKYTDGGKLSSTSNEESLRTEKLNTEPNISTIYVSNMQASSTQNLHYLNDLNEVDSLSSTQTNLATAFSRAELESTSSMYSITTQPSFTVYPLKENNYEDETSVSTQGSDKTSHFAVTDAKTDVITSSEISTEILSSTEHGNESNVSSQNNYTASILTEIEGDSDFHAAGNSDKPIDHTEHTSLESTNNTLLDGMTKMFSSSSTESVPSSFGVRISTDNVVPSSYENVNATAEIFHYPRPTSEKSTEITSNGKETTRENTFSVDDTTDTKQFNTDPILDTHGIEVNTFPSTAEVSSLGITETHREGKHIPFSPTSVRNTTEYPRIFNVTVKTFSHSPEPETTENNFLNLLYNQIKAEELSPEERSNLINAVVKLPDTLYSKEILNEKIAIIHLWLLHAIADEYKNSTVNLSESKNGQLDEIEFENLPQILYVLPTPEIYLPNISFTFVVQNKWRNETFPVDIVLTILNLHIEDLKHLVEIEDIHFSHGLLVQKHDLLSVIIEKYGIILLSTCLITFAMIFLLICVVIYYRRKTRHSAHCLTDDKLHRNMQEAMGIDLNPAVVILQEEIREKAALNGNKICNLNDDEGWLAPIGDVPVEDNNAPFVQDTKL